MTTGSAASAQKPRNGSKSTTASVWATPLAGGRCRSHWRPFAIRPFVRTGSQFFHRPTTCGRPSTRDSHAGTATAKPSSSRAKPTPQRKRRSPQLRKYREHDVGGDPVDFMDAAFPQPNPMPGCGWIERGKERVTKTNTGRRRLNTNGAINTQMISAQIRFDDTLIATPTIALIEQIQKANPTASRIITICVSAR